jgi:molybdate transport system ATP-binding protein
VTAAALEASFVVQVGTGEGRFQLQAELALRQGVLVLYGPSGAGKSLTLCALAGLTPLQSGSVSVGSDMFEDSVAGCRIEPQHRRLGYVPQHNALFPFCDVESNISFGLPRAERRPGNPVVKELMDELGVLELRRAQPASLSGGERQRVALARALAVQPQLLLLDEPFAFIDPRGRKELREVLRGILRSRGISAVLVTHSREEALAMADSVALYERGRTLRSGSPAEVLADED